MIKKIIMDVYDWVKKNSEKLIVLIALYGATTYVLTLPYINLIRIITSSLPMVITWVAIVILFRPKNTYIIKGACILLVVAFLFACIHLQNICDKLGDVVYLFVATYVITSLKEYKQR